MKRGVTYFLFFAFLNVGLEAQYIEMSFTDPFKDTDLSNNNANCITQDTTGFIWIGTRNGLNRFDGYDIKIYKHDYLDTNSLLSHDIKLLYTDTKGRVWVGTRNGLCLYRPLTDDFKRVAHHSDSCGLSNLDISFIHEDANQNLYVSNSSGIFIYDEISREFKEIFTVQSGEISTFLFDENDNMWIGTYKKGGLIYFNRHNQKSTLFLHDENNPNSLSGNSAVSLALVGHKLWIATYEGGINCYDTYTQKFKHYFNNTEYEKYARTVYLDKDKRIWTIDVTGLKLYDPTADIFHAYYTYANFPNTIKPGIAAIYQDKHKNYWTLHAGQGVGLRTPPKGFSFFSSVKERFWHISFDRVSAIMEDGDSNLWIGNPENGINIFKWDDKKTEAYFHSPNDKYSLGSGSVHVIYRDSKDQVWVGTHMGGLQLFDKKNKKFISYKHDPNNKNSIANNDVRSIAEDREGNYWVVTHGNGIDKFNVKENKFYHYTSTNSNLSNDYAFQIMIDRKDNVWVGTVWGLSLLNKKTQQFHNFYHDPNVPGSISSNEINCLYEDVNGGIWIGTNDGLNFFISKDSTFKSYKENFINTNIGSILRDNMGRIWFGTMDGIAVFDTSTMYYRNFDDSDGLPANEIAQRSATKSSGNTFYFGCIKGVVSFDPNLINYNKTPPNVIITKFKLFNREVTEYGNNSPLKGQISHVGKINLDHTEKVITFEFAAISFITSFKNKYKYKLENFDDTWIEAGTKREVTYTNLDPGKYKFRVMASNNDGIWNEKGASVELIITPPWWKTTLFRFIAVFIITLLFFLIYLNRTEQLRKQKSLLEGLVKKRTKELIEKNNLLENQADDLNNINTLLEERQQHIIEQSEELKVQAEKLSSANHELEQANSTKNKLFSIIAHDLKDPFNTILGFSEYLTDEFENVENEDKIKMITAINTSSQKVHTLLDNLLKWARTQTSSIQLKKANINVLKLVQNSYYVLKENLASKEIELIYDIPEELTIYVDENTMQTALRNLINNAIKFTPVKGAININAQKINTIVNLSISDTGVGMDKETLENLFIIEKNRTLSGTEGEKGSGLGLIICKEFVELNMGSITVTSEIEKGSTFCISLPSTIE